MNTVNTISTIDRSNCTAARHGTYAAYQRARCRCPDAREDCRLYYKRFRNGRPYKRRVDAAGTRRRIQALYAIGHTGATIGAAAGLSAAQVQQTARLRRGVAPATAAAVRRAYDALSAVPGSSSTTRRRAVAKGWLPPRAWDDDIDDPTVDPHAPVDPTHVDDIAVARAIAGDKAAGRNLNDAERAEAVRVGLRRGLAPTRLAELLGTHSRTIHQLAATAA